MNRHEVLGLVDILILTKHHQVANLEPKMRSTSHYSFPLLFKNYQKNHIIKWDEINTNKYKINK